MQYSYRIRALDGTLLVDGATFVVYSTQKEANDAAAKVEDAAENVAEEAK